MPTSLTEQFFEKPILNSPYECPERHWELDEDGQPTNQILARRRRAEFITPIPKPKKRRQAQGIQGELVLYSGAGLSSEVQHQPDCGTQGLSGRGCQGESQHDANLLGSRGE